ncbi:MAG: GNAT family N-acetyltransferase [Flavobacteriaceae bacterium]|nr:GNAT family N-acetyltransferase [Flavobacteriaceae bacterium]
MIRLAYFSDLNNVKKITEACAEEMISKKIFQWNEHYPSRKVFEKDIMNKELYVTEMNNSIVGCIMFSKHKDELYNKIDWLTPDPNNLYIHRLAVHPKSQKKGLARSMMDFAEEEAIKMKCLSVRLDTFSQNSRNSKFYRARGYIQLGDVHIPKQSEYPFYCFEKILKY